MIIARRKWKQKTPSVNVMFLHFFPEVFARKARPDGCTFRWCPSRWRLNRWLSWQPDAWRNSLYHWPDGLVLTLKMCFLDRLSLKWHLKFSVKREHAVCCDITKCNLFAITLVRIWNFNFTFQFATRKKWNWKNKWRKTNLRHVEITKLFSACAIAYVWWKLGILNLRFIAFSSFCLFPFWCQTLNIPISTISLKWCT